jgi:hypothetical protein
LLKTLGTELKGRWKSISSKSNYIGVILYYYKNYKHARK